MSAKSTPAAATAPPEVHALIRDRWSPRVFSDREVTTEELRTLFDAARWTASSYNEQPWRFIVATTNNPEAYAKMLSVLVEQNQAWAKSAPVLLLTLGKKTFTRTGGPNRHGLHDAGMALATLMLQATSMGLHTHGMAGFDPVKARALFQIPDDYEPAAAVAIGYLDAAATQDPRTRKPLDELVFGAEWGKPAKL